MNLVETFQGVTIQKGSLVRCRDPSSFEIVMRINQKYSQQPVKAIFSQPTSSTESQSLFVSDNNNFKENVYAWLNPFKHRESMRSKTITTLHSDYSEDDDD